MHEVDELDEMDSGATKAHSGSTEEALILVVRGGGATTTSATTTTDTVRSGDLGRFRETTVAQLRSEFALPVDMVVLESLRASAAAQGYTLAFVPTHQITTPKAASAAARTPEEKFDPYEVGRRAVEALKLAEGGSLSRTEAAARLNLSLAGLYLRLQKRQIVAWTDANGRMRFPVWQFGANGMLPGIVDCLEALGRDDEWAVMRFFLTPVESMGSKSALTFLREGRIDLAKEMAERSGVHG